jgi:hypothetical protein
MYPIIISLYFYISGLLPDHAPFHSDLPHGFLTLNNLISTYPVLSNGSLKVMISVIP